MVRGAHPNNSTFLGAMRTPGRNPLAAEIRARLLATMHGAVLVPFGEGWRVLGPGVDVLLGDLNALHLRDFESPGELLDLPDLDGMGVRTARRVRRMRPR